MDSQLSFSFHLAHVSFAPCSPTPFAFFPTCDHHQSTMTAELPPSWFRSSGSLASLRWLMGWQAPGSEHRLKRRVVPLSSFFLMLLEFYGLQL
jgi:hypothetical protein